MIAIPYEDHRLGLEGAEFIFREVRSQSEMHDALALRYSVYSRASELSKLHSLDSVTSLDVDEFDEVSQQFVLLERKGQRDLVVGTLRLTTMAASPQVAALRSLASAHPTVAARLAAGREAALPLLGYLRSARVNASAIERRLEDGERLIEAGRFTLDPGTLAATARRGIRLSHFMIRCAIAHVCGLGGADRVLIHVRCCARHLEQLYGAFGFRRSPSLSATLRDERDTEFVILEATPESVPQAFVPGIQELAHGLIACGEARLRVRSRALRTLAVAEA